MRAVLLGVVGGLLVSAAAVVLVILALPEEPLGRSTLPSNAPTSSPRATVAPTAAASASASPSASPPANASGSAEGSVAVGLRVGDAAPPLTLPQLGGGTIDLAAIEDRPVWVNFTASWCPTCRDELPLMERIQAQLDDRLTVIAVDVREDPDTVASLASELGLTLPIGLDQEGRAQLAWGAYALPVHYWVDADGRIRYVLYGAPGPDQFIEGVRSVLPGARIEL
jgi:thiol-disulfide isomerase/thioredoxin